MHPATSDGLLPAIPGYRLRDQIGRGGFGVVYVGAAEVAQPVDVAVKVLHRVLDVDAHRRFDSEIQIMGTLGWHPNIVRILDAGAVQGQPFIVMEFLPDGSLGAALRAEGPLPWALVLRHAVDAATALQVAHNAGLLHRDIKPDNLLRTPEGGVKLSDFGVTVAAGSTEGERGATGTLAYSAPELLAGASPSPASDIYALGATMFALLSGDPAFHRATDESPAAMILRAYRDPLPDLRPTGTPESLVRVIERAMAKDPRARPASAADLVKELRGAAAAESVPLPPPVPTGQHRPAAAAPFAAPAGILAQRPSAASRKRAQRLQRIAGGVTAVAALFIAVSVITISDFGQEGGDSAPPAAVAPDEPALDEDDPGDEAPQDDTAGEAPAVPPLPEPQATPIPATPPPAQPPPAPAPAPAPLPDVSAPAPISLPPLALTASATGGAGDGQRSIVATATTLEVYDPQGVRTAGVRASGITELAMTGDVVAAVSGGDTVTLLDADSLTPLATTSLPGTADITGAGGSFWVATDTGLFRLTTDGTARPVRGDRATLTQVAATGDVVWTSTEGGDLAAFDGRSGRRVASAAVGGKVTELGVAADGSALVVLDGVLQAVGTDGRMRDLEMPGPVIDVAATTQGSVYVLTLDGLFRLGAESTPVTTSDVANLWPSGPVVFAAVDAVPMVERYG